MGQEGSAMMEIPDLTDYPHLNEFINKKDKFILDENNNAIPATLMEWDEYLEKTPANKKRVGRDRVNNLLISTVFLGLDHSFDESLDIFETMIFEGDKSEKYCKRYSTWKEAEEGHQRAIQWVKDGCNDE